jgi:hypothetical protein
VRRKRHLDVQLLQAALNAFPGPPDNAPGPFKERYDRSVDALRRGQCDDCGTRRADAPHKPVDNHVAFQISIHHASTCPLHPPNLERYARELGFEWHKESMAVHQMTVAKDGRVLDTEP